MLEFTIENNELTNYNLFGVKISLPFNDNVSANEIMLIFFVFMHENLITIY